MFGVSWQWIVLAGLLHATAGYLWTDRFTPYPPLYGFIGAILPDLIDAPFMFVDLGFPWVHRGIVHTPFMLLIVVFLFWILEWEAAIWGVGLGYFSHLVYDTLSGWGVMWLYPLTTEFTHLNWGLNAFENLVAIVGLTVLFVLILPEKRRLHRTT